MQEYPELTFLAREIEKAEYDFEHAKRLAEVGVNSSVQHYYSGMRDYAEGLLVTLRKRRELLLGLSQEASEEEGS
jgi:hypothetical protein